MTKKIMRILSYIMVALLASAVTLFFALMSMQKGQNKLLELENLILDKFIGETDQTAMEDAAADAMIHALGDRWSYYIPAEEFAAYMEQMNNAYVGVGISIQQRGDGKGLDIVEVTKGGPAEEAGLLAKDIVIAVDGQSIEGLELEEIRRRRYKS